VGELIPKDWPPERQALNFPSFVRTSLPPPPPPTNPTLYPSVLMARQKKDKFPPQTPLYPPSPTVTGIFPFVFDRFLPCLWLTVFILIGFPKTCKKNLCSSPPLPLRAFSPPRLRWFLVYPFCKNSTLIRGIPASFPLRPSTILLPL